MIAELDLETLTTEQCRECRGIHLVRALLVAEPASTRAPAMMGFFGACPRTGARAWMVVHAPDRAEPVRLARLGPLDDESWEPDEAEIPVSSSPHVTSSTRLPPSGTMNGGFRVAARAPDVLRRAWGCPFSS